MEDSSRPAKTADEPRGAGREDAAAGRGSHGPNGAEGGAEIGAACGRSSAREYGPLPQADSMSMFDVRGGKMKYAR